MNKLILIIITVAIAFGQIESIKYKDSYQSNGNDYKIKVTVKDAANSSGHGQKIYYRVYQNDEFMHPSNWDGGSFTGCRYPFTEFSDNYFILMKYKKKISTYNCIISNNIIIHIQNYNIVI